MCNVGTAWHAVPTLHNDGITVNAFQAKILFLGLSKLIFHPYPSHSFPLHVVWDRLRLSHTSNIRTYLTFLTAALVLSNRKMSLAEAQAHVRERNQQHLSPTLEHLSMVSTTAQTTVFVPTTSRFTTRCRIYALLLMVYCWHCCSGIAKPGLVPINKLSSCPGKIMSRLVQGANLV